MLNLFNAIHFDQIFLSKVQTFRNQFTADQQFQNGWIIAFDLLLRHVYRIPLLDRNTTIG